MTTSDLKKKLALEALEKTPCLVSAIDPHFRISVVNRAFRTTFGDGEGRDCFAVFKGRDRPCERCLAAKTFKDGEERVFEEEGVDRDGKVIFYRVQAVPIRDSQGVVRHVLQMSMDTTRLAEIEKELEQAERMAVVGLTTAGMAHTLKNILGGLDGGVYMVNSGLEKQNDERLKTGWSMVESYLQKVSALVKNLLQYTRPREPVFEKTDVAGLVNNVIELYATKAELSDVTLEGVVGEKLGAFMLDRESIHASLTNLVSNALDACVWDPDQDKCHRIELSARAISGGGVLFEVSDNGMGIAEKNQARIMKTFFTTKGMRGTGLGLLLTRKAAQAHGGSIRFSSEPGKGSTFFFEIPGHGPAGSTVSEGGLEEHESIGS